MGLLQDLTVVSGMPLAANRDVILFLALAFVAALVAILTGLALLRTLRTNELESRLTANEDGEKPEQTQFCQESDLTSSEFGGSYSLGAVDGDDDFRDIDGFNGSLADIEVDETLLQGLNTFPTHTFDEYRYAHEVDESDFLADF